MSTIAGSLSLHLGGSGVGSPCDSSDNIGHGTRSRRAEYLDGNQMGILGDTVSGRSDSAGAVSSVAITVLVNVVCEDSKSVMCGSSYRNHSL